MPNPLVSTANALVGVGTGTMISERALMTPKAIGLFYVQLQRLAIPLRGASE